jgi:hypothetical protein
MLLRVIAVPPEDGQVTPETCRGINYNKTKIIKKSLSSWFDLLRSNWFKI